MNALECIIRRHSYRGEYINESVPREDLTRIMEAGLAAPSGCNKQTTSLIAVDDEELVMRLKSVIEPPSQYFVSMCSPSLNISIFQCLKGSLKSCLLSLIALNFKSLRLYLSLFFMFNPNPINDT